MRPAHCTKYKEDIKRYNRGLYLAVCLIHISVILKLTDLQDVAPLLQDTNRIILTLFFQTNTNSQISLLEPKNFHVFYFFDLQSTTTSAHKVDYVQLSYHHV